MKSEAMGTSDPIYSTYADDEMMGELIELFVAEIPERIDTLCTAFEQRDLVLLERTAHQLKGAFGSYGFGCMTIPAQLLERSASDPACPLETLHSHLQAFVRESQRLTAGQAE